MFLRRFPKSDEANEKYVFCMSCGISKQENSYEQCSKCYASKINVRNFHPETGDMLIVPYSFNGILFKNRDIKTTKKKDKQFESVDVSKIKVHTVENIEIGNPPEGVINEFLNLIFLIDATGSMNPFIKEAINHIENQQSRIIDAMKVKLVEQYGDVTKFILHAKTSVIAYRDVVDITQIEYCPQTTDANRVKQFLTEIVPKGGGDIPEDILAAFDFTFKNIKFPEKDSIDFKHTSNVLILVADAPAHGMFMHDFTIMDDVIRHNDEELWIKTMEQLRELNTDFVCVQLTEQMDTMIDFFRKYHNQEGLFEMQLVREVKGDIVQSRISMEKCIIDQLEFQSSRFIAHKSK